jgi:hypothetical protein
MELEQNVEINIDDITQISDTDKRKEYLKNYYQLNKEKIFKKYYADHKDEMIERAKISKNKIKTEDAERYKQMRKEWNKKAYEKKKMSRVLNIDN